MRVALGLGEGEAPPPALSFADALPAVRPAPAPELAGPAPVPDAVEDSSPRTHTSTVLRAPAPPPPEPLSSDAPPPASADTAGEEVDEAKACADGMAQARKLAEALPADDPSRYFAERYLQQAATEIGSGETDECREFVGQAIDEVKEHRHTLAPGEKLHILRPDE